MTFDELNLKIPLLIDNLVTQIKTKHPNLDNIVLVGIIPFGSIIAQRIKRKLNHTKSIPVGEIEIGLYRDDLPPRDEFVTLQNSDIPFDINNKTLILVDAVLFHGRRTRAALNGLTDFGRPNAIELAVLLDRGHRKLPIQPNYIGNHIETKEEDTIDVKLVEIDGEDNIAHTTRSGQIA